MRQKSRLIWSCGILILLTVTVTSVAQAKIVAISADSHVLALNDDGTVYSWGNNWFGEVGVGNYTYLPGEGNVGNPRTFKDPQKVPIDNVTTISAYAGMSLALKSDGTVWAWGEGEYGELGYGGTDRQVIPVEVKNLTNVTAIAAGAGTCYALKDDGTVWAWGNNNRGDVDGTTEDRPTPVQVEGLSNITALGEHGTYAIRDDGTVYAWGNNVYSFDGNTNITTYGALGNSSNVAIVWPPCQVEGVSNVKQISGPNPTLYVKNDGTVWTWGSNYYGATGDGTSTQTSQSENHAPSVQAKIDDVKELSSNDLHAIALKNDDTVWTWGRYIDSVARSNVGSGMPVKVNAPGHVVQVCAGGMCDYALMDDGSIWGWGTGSYNELREVYATASPTLIWKGPGQNDTNDTSTPATNTPAPTPGFDTDTVIVLSGTFTVLSLLAGLIQKKDD